MLIQERQNLIIRELRNNPNISIRELAQMLHYSEPTIRRDCAELEKHGILKRHYGGASLAHIAGVADLEIPFVLRENEGGPAKKKIGMLASAHVRDGMVIMLDGSSTVYHLLPYLTNFNNIIVITSGAKTAVALAELHIPVFCTGGKMRTNSFSYIGKDAEDSVRKYNADIMFFSCHGLSREGRLTDVSVEECNLRQIMMEKSREKYLLCDSSKFNKTFFYEMGNVKQLNGVISDQPLPKNIKNLINAQG